MQRKSPFNELTIALIWACCGLLAYFIGNKLMNLPLGIKCIGFEGIAPNPVVTYLFLRLHFYSLSLVLILTFILCYLRLFSLLRLILFLICYNFFRFLIIFRVHQGVDPLEWPLGSPEYTVLTLTPLALILSIIVSASGCYLGSVLAKKNK